MTTLLVTQPNYTDHRGPPGHPERPERVAVVEAALAQPAFGALLRREAPTADLALAELVHSRAHLDRLRRVRPAEGIAGINEDTYISPRSLDAVASALGAGLAALDAVALGEADNAFCAIRPPGHHAEAERAMGFCLVNTVAVVAREAQRKYGAERVAIIDFDVHHGNGTQDIFFRDPTVLYASSHQMPLYPHTGEANEIGVGNIVNAPLRGGSDGEAMRAAYLDLILPAVDAFAPDMILISAGFDADARDPLASLCWKPADFAWLTSQILDIAELRCEGRVVSLLEGGYNLTALAEDAAAHVAALAGLIPG